MTRTIPVCSGSDQKANALPGREVCPVCETWQRVKEDGRFGKHRRLPVKYPAVFR